MVTPGLANSCSFLYRQWYKAWGALKKVYSQCVIKKIMLECQLSGTKMNSSSCAFFFHEVLACGKAFPQ